MLAVLGIITSVSSEEKEKGGYDTDAQGGFPEAVEAYRPLITKLAEEYNTQPDKLELPLYVNALLAFMEVESGGRGTDPMQASECGYNTEYPRSANAIQDAEYSCRCGVQYARDAFIKFDVTGPEDFERLAAAVQGYNFGIDGWHAWITERGGRYTLELAQEYSRDKMPAGKKGTPSHAQKFLNAYKRGIANSSVSDAVVNPDIDDPGGYGEAMAKWGLQYVGCKYSQNLRWSNCYTDKNVSRNNSYWDCSSFAWCAMNSVGLDIPKTSSVASAEAKWCADKNVVVCNGYDPSKMQAGDLIFYRRASNTAEYKSIGHVSIYIGNGKCVHAKGTQYGVLAESVSGIDTVVFVARPAALVK